MRVALITALPPSGGAGAARVESRPRPAKRARNLTVRVNRAEVDANQVVGTVQVR